MKILVAGGRGQLGRSVAMRGASAGHQVLAPAVDELDICDPVQVRHHVQAAKPDLVINAAAYTAVDAAEGDRDRAFAVNRDGAGILARECSATGVPLLHISTDYVFDGTATGPYREDDETRPLGVYGASKAEGERLVRSEGGCVVRTSWLFSAAGPSFVQTILRLAAERPILRVVSDQRGCPTWSDDLADALLELSVRRDRESLYHFCGDGATTWHGFAVSIVEEARRHRTIACTRVDPITTAEYPTRAARPAYSVLDTSRIRKLGIVPPSWKTGLSRVIAATFGAS